jgi:hypothetical protein
MVLNGTRNVTLRTLATFGLACEERWVFSAVAQVGAGVSTLASMDLGRPQGQDPQVGSQPG